jgi:uncharacterized membrane protein
MRRHLSVANTFFALHALLIALSVAAFWLVIDRPLPGWADPALWARGYAIGMHWTGALYIATGFVAAAAGWMAAAGRRRGLAGIAAVVLLALGIELTGVATGFPFGGYAYGTTLGPRVLGLVPVVIPLSWFLMLYASVAIAVRFRRGLLGTALIASLGLLAWDVLMDPAMSIAFPFWSWQTSGVYFGMPLVSWAGWLFTGVVIAVPLLWLARYRPLGSDRPAIRAAFEDDQVAERLAQQRMPLYLYALNGLFPFALALSRGMIGTALTGGAVMALFLASPLLLRTRPLPVPIAARQT